MSERDSVTKASRGIVVFAFLWFVLSLFAGTAALCADPAPAKGIVPERVPAVAVKDLDGNPIDLPAEASKNRALLVNFWGVRCADCIAEMAVLDGIYRDYREKKFDILAVNVDGIGPEVIVTQLRRLRDIPKFRLVPDPEFQCTDLFRMGAAPLTLLFDRTGKAVYRHEGFRPGDEKGLVAAIESALSD